MSKSSLILLASTLTLGVAHAETTALQNPSDPFAAKRLEQGYANARTTKGAASEQAAASTDAAKTDEASSAEKKKHSKAPGGKCGSGKCGN